MYDFIPSKYIREYLEKTGVVLSEYEQAMIYFDYCMKYVLEDRISGMRRAVAETHDEELRSDLEQMLAEFDAQWDDFITNDGSFIYTVNTMPYFKYEDAYKGMCEVFYNAPEILKSNHNCIHKIKLEKKGKLVFLVEFNGDKRESFDNLPKVKYDPLNYPLKFIKKKKLPINKFPFERGDFVLNLKNGEVGVVEKPEDFRVGVIALNYNGEPNSRVWNAFFMEKLDGFEREGKYEDLLRAVRGALLGEVSLSSIIQETMFLHYEKYKCSDHRIYGEGYEPREED